MTQSVLVTEVTGEDHSFTLKLPGDLILHATGTVPTSGWTGAELVRHFYVVPPADGIMDVEFRAVPPNGMALQVVTPISAGILIGAAESADFWAKDNPLKGVRIVAKTNAIVVPVDGNQRAPNLPNLFDPVSTHAHDPDVPVPLKV